MSSRQAIGRTLDALGVMVSLAEDDMVTDAVLLLKVVESDGDVRLSTAWSEGMSWIERLGMIAAAQAVEMPSPGDSDDDDGA